MTQRPRPGTAELLDLAPHPEGGGWYRATWRAAPASRPDGWHGGGPLLMLDGGDGDRPSAQPETTTLGAGLERGDVPQHVVPGRHWCRGPSARWRCGSRRGALRLDMAPRWTRPDRRVDAVRGCAVQVTAAAHGDSAVAIPYFQ